MPQVYSLPVNPEQYYVYVVLCRHNSGSGFVKFGRSMNVLQRLSQIRSTCPIPAHYFAYVQTKSFNQSQLLEQKIHEHFAHRRIKGEWYKFDFDNSKDKQEFNHGCRNLFYKYIKNQWWTKVNIQVLDEYSKEKRRKFLHSKHKAKLRAKQIHELRVKKAWQELDNYGLNK